MGNEAGVSAQQRRRTRSEIEEIVAKFANSGLNRSEFCRRHGITLGTLNRHLRRLGQPASTQLNDGLVAVELAGERPARDYGSGGVAVVLSRGRRSEVSAGFDAPTLERLLALLEAM